jgi:replication factor C subunit 1
MSQNTTDGSELWANRFKPSKIPELIGNGKCIADLRRWLGSWQNNESVKNKNKTKAVLISGPPGIGKTSSASIVCEQLGFTVMEVNASDSRNKASKDINIGLSGSTSNQIKELVTNYSLNFMKRSTSKKHVLIMDEVDGMTAGDRGGVSDLIDTIKSSKIPIICICNDRFSQKLKSLQNHCLELNFQQPTKQQIFGRLSFIIKQENVEVSSDLLDNLIESCNGDIRLILNQLQLMKLRTSPLSNSGGKMKDVSLGALSILDIIMRSGASRNSVDHRIGVCFQDDLVPLYVQENFLQMKPANCCSDLQRLNFIGTSSRILSDGDLISSLVRSRQSWELAPYSNLISCVIPSSIVSGIRETFNLSPGERNFHRFPTWLGKNSSNSKMKRLLNELHGHMVNKGTLRVSSILLRQHYIPLLRSYTTIPLLSNHVGGFSNHGVHDVVRFMSAYGITRADWDSLMELRKFNGKGHAFESKLEIPTSVKSSFTRECNKCLEQILPKQEKSSLYSSDES